MNRKWATKSACLALLLAGTLIAAGCPTEPEEPADLVLYHGKIVTVDAAGTEAQAVAIKDGRIMALGNDREIRTHVGSKTETIDLRGNLAIPGFIEGHGHFMGLGDSKLILDLRSAGSWQDIVDMVAGVAAQAAPGEWIRGRGPRAGGRFV